MKITGRGLAAVGWGLLTGGTGFIGSLAKKLPNQNSGAQKFLVGTAFHLSTLSTMALGIVAAPFTLGGSLSLTGGALAAEIGYMITAGRGSPERQAELTGQRRDSAHNRYGMQ